MAGKHGPDQKEQIRETVREGYGKIAKRRGSCCGSSCCGSAGAEKVAKGSMTAMRDFAAQALDSPTKSGSACCAGAAPQGGESRRFEYIADFLFDEMPEADARRVRSSELMIGKHSAINYTASKINQPVRWIASLTQTDGRYEFTGILVARADGPIARIGDLQRHKVSLGMPFHVEKHDAALAALRRENASPAEVRYVLLCRDAVADVVAGRSDAAVISDYSQGLLQTPEVARGVKLPVIGKTDEVPYIAVFANAWVPGKDVDVIRRFLTEQTREDRGLMKALQSGNGFLPAPTDLEQRR